MQRDGGDMSDDGVLKRADTPVLSESERKLAGQAQNAFEAGSYGECLTHLSQLRVLRPVDHKVLHNIAVAKYYYSGLTQTGDFVNSLTGLKAQLEASSKDGGEVEKRVLLFNLAIVHLQLQQYTVATSIAERLLPRVDLFSDSFSRSVYFLLCDLYLLTSETGKASWLLSKIEKYSSQNYAQPGSAGMAGRQERSQIADRERTLNPLDEQELRRLCQLKVRLVLMKRAAKKACKRELSSLMASSSQSATAVFLKSQSEFLNKKYVKSAKLLGDCPKSSVNSSGEELSLRQANASALSSSMTFHADLFYNNMACVFSRLQRHHAAALYCKQALQMNSDQLAKAAAEHGESCLASLDIYHRHRQLLYNTGVLLLSSGQPAAAFECLLRASKVFYTSPLLWLRLAEACVGVQQEAMNAARQSGGSQIVGSVGSGSHRKTVVAAGKELQGRHTETAAIPSPTLEFANLCLKNALSFLKSVPSSPSHSGGSEAAGAMPPAHGVHSWTGQENGDSSRHAQGDGDGRTTGPSGLDSVPPSSGQQFPYQVTGEVVPLKASILRCGAYVSLCLGDFVVARNRAKELLSLPSLPGSYRCYGCMYAAEALMELNRLDEAIAVLSPEQLTDMNGFQNPSTETVSLPTTHADNFQPVTLAAGKASLYINLSTVHSMNGNIDRARRCLLQACTYFQTLEPPPETIQLAAFLELQSDNVSGALLLLKHNSIKPLLKQAAELVSANKVTPAMTKRNRKNQQQQPQQ